MAGRSISENQRVRYLLGLSSPAEREHIESAYFEADDAFEEMVTAEDDLIDAYARGELSSQERQRFERIFVSSVRGRDRVQFARAFAGTISATQSFENRLPGTLHGIFTTLRSPGLLRPMIIAAVTVLLAVFAWLVIDRRRATNELHELRAEYAKLSTRTGALQRNNDHQRADNPSNVRAAATRDGVVGAVNTSDASLGNSFEQRPIIELPLNANNIVGLRSLQPDISRTPSVTGGRANQSNITLDGVDANIRIPSSLSWFRFQIALQTAATHETYRLTVKSVDGRPVTSVDWIEPLGPDQMMIDTPVISTSDLPPGDYVLLLMGKELDGSFVKVAEYSFNVVK